MADAALPSTWSETYGGGKDDRGSTVIRLSDGYAVVGSTESIGDSLPGLPDVYFVKTNLNGNVQQSWTYGGNNVDWGYAAIKDGDSFVIAGATFNGGYNFYLLKINPDGTQAWNKTYGGTGDQVAHSVARVGSNYLITGIDAPNNGVYLVKTGMTGATVWANSYVKSGHQLRGSCVIGVTGGYLVVGEDIQSDDSDVYILKVNSNGTIDETMTVGEADMDEKANSVIAVGGYYYIIGTSSNSRSSSAYVLKVDQDLNKIWDRNFGGNVSGYSIMSDSDGLIIAGNSKYGIVKQYFARISRDGDLIREYYKSTTNNWYINSLISASDGDFVVAGTAYDATGDMDMFLSKVDSSKLDPTPTPAPSPSSAPTPTPTASSSPTPAPTEEPETGPEPTDGPGVVTEPTAGPTTIVEASVTLVPGAGETATPAASPVPAGDFSTSSVIIIILLTVIATALVGIGVWLFTRKR